MRQGGTYISPLLCVQLVDLVIETSRPGAEQRAGSRGGSLHKGTRNLKLIAEGKSSKEMAGLLFISIRTV